MQGESLGELRPAVPSPVAWPAEASRGVRVHKWRTPASVRRLHRSVTDCIGHVTRIQIVGDDILVNQSDHDREGHRPA
jgi:hypothetical protein